LQDCNPKIQTPIVDGTGYSNKIDIDLSLFPTNLDEPAKLASVRAALQRNGLDLKEEYREIERLVIEDRK
jgi:hypothetical protein